MVLQIASNFRLHLKRRNFARRTPKLLSSWSVRIVSFKFCSFKSQELYSQIRKQNETTACWQEVDYEVSKARAQVITSDKERTELEEKLKMVLLCWSPS